jgi:DNA transformation protein and related proteins
MSTGQQFADFVVEQSSRAGDVYARKMFGEYALYCDNKVVGLITDNTLYIKITDGGKKYVGNHYQEGIAYKSAKISMLINEDLISDRDWLAGLSRITAKSLPLPKKKKIKSL